MKKWQDLAKLIWAKIWTPSNRDKAIDAAIEQARKLKAQDGAAAKGRGNAGEINRNDLAHEAFEAFCQRNGRSAH